MHCMYKQYISHNSGFYCIYYDCFSNERSCINCKHVIYVEDKEDREDKKNSD